MVWYGMVWHGMAWYGMVLPTQILSVTAASNEISEEAAARRNLKREGSKELALNLPVPPPPGYSA